MRQKEYGEYLQEKLNRRSLYLRLMRRCWIIPAAGVLFAVLAGLIYTGIVTNFSGQKNFLATGKLYIDFAWNEETQKAYDYYNAATWDELIFAHPGITETLEKELPEGITLQAADEMTKAELISDIRVMSVSVTAPAPETAEGVLNAVCDGITAFGKSAKEFEQITHLSSTEPILIVVRDRRNNAILLGAFLGVVISFAVLYIGTLMDDRVYVPEDIEDRTGVPVLCVRMKDGKGPRFLAEEEKDFMEKYGESAKEKFLSLVWGKDCVSRAVHEVYRLRTNGQKPEGIIITEADGRFLAKYYRD